MKRALLCVLVISYTGAFSQTGSSIADETWAAIKEFGRPSLVTVDADGKQLTQTAKAARFVEQADQLRAFYIKNPNHSSAKEAKRREALALNQAALNGNMSEDARRMELIAAVRKDSTLQAVKRFEAVAWSNQVAIKRQKSANRAAFLAAHELAARGLIAEFENVSDGYESLLGIARGSAPERSQSIARDLLAMPAAPSWIKAGAQHILDQLALVGKPLALLFAQAGAVAPLTDQNRPTILYTWTAAIPPSLTTVKRLARQAPQARFIGVCLDTDINAAKQTAASDSLPGDQYYDAQGSAGRLPAALQTGAMPVLYLVDRQAVIRDVRGSEEFSRKIAELAL